MSARDDILAAVRGHGPAAQPLPEVPDFASGSDDLVDLFTAALALLDGKVIPRPPSGLDAWLSAAFPDARRICSAIREVTGNVNLTSISDWAAPADVDVLVMRTPLGVAETGSILLTETEVSVTTAAVLARHLVVLLDPADIVDNLHLAYRHSALHEAAYAVLPPVAIRPGYGDGGTTGRCPDRKSWGGGGATGRHSSGPTAWSHQ